MFVIVSFWLGAFPNQASAAYLTVDFDGSQTIDDGLIVFSAEFAPPAVEIGEVTTLNLTLVNQGSSPLAPLVTIQLPPNFSLAVSQLRSGATYNFQTGEISWQPVVVGDSVAEVALPVSVSYVPADQPEQIIPLTVSYGQNNYQTDVRIWVGEKPIGSFAVNPVRGSVGQPIQLLANISGSGPIRQVWSLGDGRVVPATNPVVVFPQVGTYEVELQAINPAGVHRVTETVVIGPEPAAFFRPSDTSPGVNQNVTFSSQSGGEGPLEYSWNFGDGSSATVPNPTHQYTTPGTYNVVLTVRNQYGQAQNFLPITVGDPPIADVILPEAAEAGLAITGQAFTDDNTLSVVWDMGDGSELTGETISYAYNSSGDYLVTVNASNNFGSTVMTRFIRVTGGAFYLHMPIIYGQNDEAIIVPLQSETELVAETIEFVENETDILLVSNPEISTWTLTEQLLWYINEARSQAGLRAVVEIQDLSLAAKNHTNDMAGEQFTSHTGSDGSQPYERIARTTYRQGGYAGEATAWGFQDPVDVVDFWLNSPPHRAIVLNPIADHVGVAQTINYNAPSIWYWTAEFASSLGSIQSQMISAGIRQVRPEIEATYAFTETAIMNWSWPLPLSEDQQFVVYIIDENGNETPLGQVDTSVNEEQPFTYALPVGGVEMGRTEGAYQWLVRLEETGGSSVTRSEERVINLTGIYPTPFPSPTATLPPILPSPTPVPTLAATATVPAAPAPIQPSPTPLGSEPTNPTVTPTPSPEQSPTPAVEPSPTLTPQPTATSTPLPTSTLSPLPTIGTQPTATSIP